MVDTPEPVRRIEGSQGQRNFSVLSLRVYFFRFQVTVVPQFLKSEPRIKGWKTVNVRQNGTFLINWRDVEGIVEEFSEVTEG